MSLKGLTLRRLVAACAVAATAAAGVSATAPESALAQTGGFADVAEDAYYSVPVSSLAERGVFAGTECDEGFCPDDPIDRKTVAVWVVRVLDDEDPEPVSESRFDDVDAADFHARFIERMAQLGVTQGCGDGSAFCPDDNMNRAEMAVFLARAYNPADGPDPDFADVADDAWYAADVARLAASGITKGCGDGTRFCPDEDTLRGQMATFLYRAENPDEAEATEQSSGSAVRVNPAMDGGGIIAARQSVVCNQDRRHDDLLGYQLPLPMRALPLGSSLPYRWAAAIRVPSGATAPSHAGDAMVTDRQTPPPGSSPQCPPAAATHVDCVLTRPSGAGGRTTTIRVASYYGQADAPAGKFTAVSAGSNHSCGLRVDKTVTCWGSNYDGWGETHYGQAEAPSGEFISVSAGTSLLVRHPGLAATSSAGD